MATEYKWSRKFTPFLDEYLIEVASGRVVAEVYKHGGVFRSYCGCHSEKYETRWQAKEACENRLRKIPALARDGGVGGE